MVDPQRILLIQLKRAGDVIVTTPVITALKKRFSVTAIDFLVEKPFAPILENNPGLNRIRVYDKSNVSGVWKRIRETHYDWIFDFQSSPRSAMVCLTSGAKVTAGYKVPFWGMAYKQAVRRPGANLSVVEGKFTLVERVTGPLPHDGERKLFLKADERQWAETVLPSTQAPMGMIPTHRHPIRRWHADSFVELGQRLQARGLPVWWFWGPGEEAYVRAIAARVPGSVVVPATSLRRMGALLARCRCVITNDNGPMHLATAVGAPTVTIYGPTDPSCWNPGGARHRAVTAEKLGCLGCNFLKCPFEHECMTRVTPEHVNWVLEDLERVLSR
jgi:ADP-heptose:LPS heptosyltransferase